MDDPNQNNTSASDANKTPEELQADIASTRERIGRDIDELSDRVNPERLQNQAKDALADTLAGAQETVMGTVNDLGQKASARAQEASSGLIGMIRSNPVPAALIGLGVGLLAAGGATVAGSSGGASRYKTYGGDAYGGFDRTGGSASDRFGTSSNDALVGAKALPRTNYAQDYGDQGYGQGYGGRAGSSSQGSFLQGSFSQRSSQSSGAQGVMGWVEEHPLAVGAVTLLLGAAIGLSAPGTRYEDETMGEMSDRSIQRAKSVVGDAVDVVKESASQATKAVKDELSERSPSKDGLKDTVKAVAGTVTSEVKDAATNVVDKTTQAVKEETNKKTGSGNVDSDTASSNNANSANAKNSAADSNTADSDTAGSNTADSKDGGSKNAASKKSDNT